MHHVFTPAADADSPAHRLPAVADRGRLLAALQTYDREVAASQIGTGTRGVLGPDGHIEVRASRDGRPRMHEGAFAVASKTRLADIQGSHEVLGSAALEGKVYAGAHVRATGDVRVDGLVERAHLCAGGRLQVDGRAFGAELAGGLADTTLHTLRATLRGTADDLEALARGEDIGAGALRLLGEGLAAAEARIATVRREWPIWGATLHSALTGARRALDGAFSITDPRSAFREAAAVLRAALPDARERPAPAVVAARLDGCEVRAYGTCIIGAGARQSHLEVEGDLLAMDAGCEIRSCVITVAGRVRVRELSARHRQPTVLTLSNPGVGVALRADVVQAGVEIVVPGDRHRFAQRASGVVVEVGPRGAIIHTSDDRR